MGPVRRSAGRLSRLAWLAWLALLLACIAWSETGFTQSAPKKYQPTYRALETELSAFQRRLPPVSAGPAPIRAATLTSANCQRGEIMLNDGERDSALRELDALKSAGAEGVVLQVCYPLLTAAFRDPQPFLDYYANLANAVRAREMKLLVEHATLLPTYASVDARPYYRKLTAQRFFKERSDELKTILLALQPDYLTLVSEPRAQSADLPLTVKDWRGYVQRNVETLERQLGSFPTLLGAGSGLWDDFAYVEAFAAIKGLGYIDLHLFPLAAGGQSNLGRLLEWPDRIRRIDPGKHIVISEFWLYKSVAEAFKSPLEPNPSARNAFSFWAPLDQKFLRVVEVAAREKRIELIAPFWSGYLFAYVDYNDPLAFQLDARGLMGLATQRAQDAIRRGQLSDTGLAFRDMQP